MVINTVRHLVKKIIKYCKNHVLNDVLYGNSTVSNMY